MKFKQLIYHVCICVSSIYIYIRSPIIYVYIARLCVCTCRSACYVGTVRLRSGGDHPTKTGIGGGTLPIGRFADI